MGDLWAIRGVHFRPRPSRPSVHVRIQFDCTGSLAEYELWPLLCKYAHPLHLESPSNPDPNPNFTMTLRTPNLRPTDPQTHQTFTLITTDKQRDRDRDRDRSRDPSDPQTVKPIHPRTVSWYCGRECAGCKRPKCKKDFARHDTERCLACQYPTCHQCGFVHPRTANPVPPNAMPDDKWLCPRCKPKRSRRSSK